jgi:heptaprenyl diphosphate synthase
MKKDILRLNQINPERRLIYLGFFTAFAVMVYILETFIPKPLPFLKIGLANIVVLMLLTSGYPWSALLVAICKTLFGGLLSGTFLSPGTLLSLGGSLLAFVAMVIADQEIFGFSIIGISICGAVAHNFGQLLVARLIVIQQDSIFYLTPFMILVGIATGLVIGYITDIFIAALSKKVLHESVGSYPNIY